MEYHLSFNLIHNASVTLFTNDQILEVVEYERYTNIKNDGVFWADHQYRKEVTKQIIEYFKNKYKILHFNLLLLNPLDVENIKRGWDLSLDSNILNFFESQKLILCDHQNSHAHGAFYQSNMEEAIIISFDGGGNDGNFNIFKGNKEGIKEIGRISERVLGHRYAFFANFCKSIKRENNWPLVGALVYPGKLMGLAGFGNVRKEWLPAFEEYFKGYPDGPETNFHILKEKLNLPDEYEGKLEKDIAATVQYMFEYTFFKETYKFWKDETNIILTGGCALNILNNQKIKELKNVYVPPNPSDCGLSVGQALSIIKPSTHIEYTFAGPEVWDKQSLMEYVIKHKGVKYTNELISSELLQGKIIGVVKNRSELGPRALGNRSIICLATFPDMKDILNKKVKNREWYRPFAPICRVEDADVYFEVNNSGYHLMSFCPRVKENYRDILSSITHIDGTARLQTVDKNSHIYNILETLIKYPTNYPPILLNTSFNIDGKPILNTYRDAIWMLENTQMDGLILEDYYIKKQ